MKTKTVTLTEPVQRGDTTIASVTLREPRAGDMRGLKLTDVLQMDFATMRRLIPRISEPGLAPDELDALPGGDFVTLSGTVVGFFFSEEMQAEASSLQ